MRYTANATPRIALRHAREEKGWTQEEAASRIGVEPNTYSRWEQGVTVPYPHNLDKLSTVYGKTSEELGFFKQTRVKKPLQEERKAVDKPRYKTRWGTELIGREKDIETIMTLLLKGDENGDEVRFLTLVGLPGVGKSELALQIEELAQEQKNFTYVKFLELETVRDVDIAQKLIGTYLQSTNILVLPYIQKRTLLILDNCEQLIKLLDYLYNLVFKNKQLTILATSRAIFSKKIYPVLPLAVPPTKYEPLGQLRKNESVKLFLETANEHEQVLALTEDTAQIVADFCIALDGLPLAIKIVASYVRELGLAPLHEMLLAKKYFDLEQNPQPTIERHYSLEELFAWSYNQFGEDIQAQKLFRRLAVFSDGCSSEAMAIVCNLGDLPTTKDALASIAKKLSNHHLITFRENRIAMIHNTIRDYAKRKLEDAEVEGVKEAKIIGQRHVYYYLFKSMEVLNNPNEPRRPFLTHSPIFEVKPNEQEPQQREISLSAAEATQVLLGAKPVRGGLAMWSNMAFEKFVNEEYLNLIAALEWMAEYDPDEEIAISLWSYLGVIYPKLEADPQLCMPYVTEVRDKARKGSSSSSPPLTLAEQEQISEIERIYKQLKERR